ncbi:MAG: T9SS type A sorting domain-containing protein, partial [Ignavibacteriaceae bacterium]
SSFISLKVYNILGQEVATLYTGFQKAGSYKVDFNASKLASGIYLYSLQADGFTKTMKMVLMK